MVKRGFSQALVILYWLGLALSLLVALRATMALTGAGEVLGPINLPKLVALALAYSLPLLIGWRLRVHWRAQRIAAAARVFDMEKENV